ncbi:T9SS type A sorting domain-containing protein [Nonlabens ulvanivorans]|uniref:T9SS type A sorting domain-containing protein n=1 Tax=Nonlabens ulvanivorans TaxID=906888 RepID=UPI0037C67CF0
MRKFLMGILLFSCFLSYSQALPITNSLRSFLINNTCADTNGDGNADSDADLNNDGQITSAEANLVVKVFSGVNPIIFEIDEIALYLPNLLELNIDYVQTSSSLSLSNIPNLKKLSLELEGTSSTVDISNLSTLESLNIIGSSSPVNVILNSSLNNIEWFQISNVIMNDLNISQTSVETINILNSTILSGNLSIAQNSILEDIRIDGLNGANLVNISGNGILQDVKIRNTDVNTLDLVNNGNLNTFTDVLEVFLNDNIVLNSLDITNSVIDQFEINNSYTNPTLDLSNSDLRELFLTNIDLSQITLPNNYTGPFQAYYDHRIVFENVPNIPSIQSIGSQLYGIEVINSINLTSLSLDNLTISHLVIEDNNNLQDVFLKNFRIGYNGGARFEILNNPSLKYFCTNFNENGISTYINDPNNFNGSNTFTGVLVNSYCSFFPNLGQNEISIRVIFDEDNNGCNTNDLLIPFIPVRIFTASSSNPQTNIIPTNSAGELNGFLPDNYYQFSPYFENGNYWNLSPTNVTANFPFQPSPFNQDFCVTANGTIEDLEVLLVPLEQARPGFDTDYKVVVKNKGNQTASGSVTLDFEEDFMTLLSTNPTAGNTPSNQLSWSFSNLQPFQMEEYEYTMTLNTPTQTNNSLNSNDILTFIGTVTGTGTDAMPVDNVMVFDHTVVNSYDPNDKTCLEGETIDPADVGEYVHYMIRFENTGTASAINVVIKDEIDLTQFDITTLIPLGGSHDYYTRIREGNVVEFIHENINLDFNDATNDGYVLFKIKTLPTLVSGDTFDNTAEIYFDFNFPIITNTETVTVMSTASIGATTDSSIKLFPNPASNFINLTAANRLESATIMDINGRMLSQTNFTGNTTKQRISLENLSAGIYFVTIQSELGQKVEKLIVE